MPTSVLRSNVRLAVLTGLGLALSGWLLWDLDREAAVTAAAQFDAPRLRPELMERTAAKPAVPSSGSGPSAVSAALPAERGASAATPGAPPVPAWAAGVGPAPSSSPAVQATLNQVFAPGRGLPGTAGGDARPAQRASRPVPVAGVGPAASPASASEDDAAARRRRQTENAYVQEFRDLAAADPQAMLRQAEGALSDGSEDPRKVAALRVIYETDKARALDVFVRAIATLPDRPTAEAVSVPAFAVDFLSGRIDDPAVKTLVERMAWTGYLNLSPVLRHQAARSLVAVATAADLQRYAGHPAYQQMIAEQPADEER